ncbi:MAG: DUF91 domain-containing protein [Candidatus Thermoplasmatota archaeon]|nr:DUF91 domain-containing protein [Candidatus Thermoplasmatota archaeon]
MVTTHVYIVNSTTFKVHLEYLFAGTGAKETYVDFNSSPFSKLKGQVENSLAGMMADALRIRKGDNVIFYLQMNSKERIKEGKFYGIFQAAEDWSFLDNSGNNQYLKAQLGKSLTFRTLIEPEEVYPEGVTEWEALDSIEDVDRPSKMIWSLIYRKLRGNRGNTMINPYEAERLINLIRTKNIRNKQSNIVSAGYTFDTDCQKIVSLDNANPYTGRKELIDVFPRLKHKYDQCWAFESHLQAYIVQNVGKGINDSLDRVILEGSKVDWIGNEVYCGVGMQRIDVLIETRNSNGELSIIPIELKAVEATVETVRQVSRYIEWLKQYYLPNRGNMTIRPFIVGRKYRNPHNKNRLDLINEIEKVKASELKINYAEYSIESDYLCFDLAF